jgi:hypothetical protein
MDSDIEWFPGADTTAGALLRRSKQVDLKIFTKHPRPK